MSDFYVPPADLSARILNYAGQQVLTKGGNGSHSRYGNFTRVGQIAASADGDDQYWTFEGTGTVRLIRNKSLKKVMLVDSPDEPVPVYLVDGSTHSASAASYITLEPGKGNYEGYFRMIRICSDSVRIITSEPGGIKIGKIEPGTIDAYITKLKI